jgi:predicted DNA binding CopG/RHH family protein
MSSQIPAYRFKIIHKDDNVTVRCNDILLAAIKEAKKSS